MKKKRNWFGLLVIVFIISFIGCDDKTDDKTNNNESALETIQNNYKGIYNVYGYYQYGINKIILWADLDNESWDTLKAGVPTKFELTSNSIIVTGGMYNAQTFSARTNGNKLYFKLENIESELGMFNSSDFHFTYNLTYASEGAYVIYKK